MRRDYTHNLSDGRILAYLEYGDPNGFPIFAFHGTPGSRIWFNGEDEISETHGVRLITVDRPGFGNSHQKPHRTFIHFANDIRELAQSLGMENFSVMGVSGGGAYAAACAFKYPDLVFKAGIISSTDQFENGKPPKGMAFANRISFILSRRFPWLITYLLKQQKQTIDSRPEKYVESISKNTRHLCESDRAIISKRENAEEILVQMKEAFKNGVSGTVSEMQLYCREWGFDVSNIQVPVELWHGIEDTLVPIASAQALAKKLPNCQQHYVEGKGHFLTDDEVIWKKILVSLKNPTTTHV